MLTPPTPSAPDALREIAGLLENGRLDAARDLAAQLCARHPGDPEALRLYGIALLSAGHGAAAQQQFERALIHAPRSVELHCNLASARLAQGDAGAAIGVLQRALTVAPGHPAVLIGLGNAHSASGNARAAREAYAACAASAADYPAAWMNLAGAELALGAYAEAERSARRALQLAPGHPSALFVLGHALAGQMRFAAAEAAYLHGARNAPDDASFFYQAGLMAEEQRHLADAARAQAQALAIDPGLTAALAQLVFLKRQRCDWDGLDALSTRLRAAVAAGAEGATPFSFLAEPASATEQLQCARSAARRLLAETGAAANAPFQHPARAAAAPLRVGFASNGFGEHPTGLLTVALFEALRDQGIELHLFATAADDGGPINRRLQAAAHRWHALHALPPPAMAERIHASGVDILVDLRVWGGGNISEALALRPAPLQVNWLAYPGTSGAPWIDYVIADATVLPAALRPDFSEAIARLPRCFQPSDTTRAVAEPPSRTACGLPEHGTVFACFNNSYKLETATFARLLAVLAAVPGSVLWLLSGPDGADERLRAVAHETGVDPARLVFMAKRPHAEYLARYRHADLFLDTLPYNAHTTASDAIWAGCPVLTVAGATFAGRVAASLNQHLGMPELIAADAAQFERIAVELGRDRSRCAALRDALAGRKRTSSLFDMPGFARDLAVLLRRMAQRQRAGLAAADLD